jgi:acetyl-CoA carboxylase carboxyltransferase component
MRHLVEQIQTLEARLREGGGQARIDRQHQSGKMTARERITALSDPASRFLEIGLLIAYDRYDGQAPSAGIVTGLGRIEGRPAVIVANDATVKAGAWWPETITKILRAQEIAMRNRLPIVYLVDSAGVNLPYQDGIFPGQYGAGRIFLYNSLMRRKLRIPQIAAVMGPCIAGGAYLPALSDCIIMVEGTSFMGLGGPNLVKGATGQVIESEPLGGARLHTAVSGVAHYLAKDDADCLERIRQRFRQLPAAPAAPTGVTPPARDASELRGVLPADHRMPYEIEDVLLRIFDAADYSEFQPEYAPEMLCANARLDGRPVAVIANRRGFLKAQGRPRIGGIVYAESARKVAYFVEAAERLGTPLVYLQDVSGFMVGPDAEREGIIRAGAEMVETMSCPRSWSRSITPLAPDITPWRDRASTPTSRSVGPPRASASWRAIRPWWRSTQPRWRSTRTVRCPKICARPWSAPAAITSAGSTCATPPPAATATPSSIRWKPAAFYPLRWRHPCNTRPPPRNGSAHD